MSSYKRFVPFSLLSATAVVIALAIAWEPGQAEANKPEQETPILRSSIIATGGVDAPDCPDAVWPYVTGDCLLHQDVDTARRKVRTIVIDDRTSEEHRTEMDKLLHGN